MSIKPQSEFSNFPHVNELLNPLWTPNPDRYSAYINSPQMIAGQGGIFGGVDRVYIESIGKAARGGLILDVCCGLVLGQDNPRGGYSTSVGNLANAYGIDNVFFTMESTVPERTIAARAEDMPFGDDIFSVVLSKRAVGYYPEKSFCTYWAIHEMIRVGKSGGLVSVDIGSGGGSDAKLNTQLVIEAIENVQENSQVGEKILTFKVFPDQIGIRLA